MSIERPPTIDPRAVLRWAQLPVPNGYRSPWLHDEVARRMEQRLQWIVQKPARWLHWEPVRGSLQAHELLVKRYPEAVCFVVENHLEYAQAAHKFIAKPWWHPACWGKTAVSFGLPSEPVQMLWANMALHLSADPLALIAQWHRLVASDGFVMFSCLGPDTAKELRALYGAMGWEPPSHEFTDMHDWGDMLVREGFAEPVMDMERITLSYSSPETLLQELRELGRNFHPARHASLRGRGWRQKLCATLARQLSQPTEDGRLQLTFEIIYGHAFKPKPRVPVRAQTTMTLEEMRIVLKQGKTAKG